MLEISLEYNQKQYMNDTFVLKLGRKTKYFIDFFYNIESHTNLVN